MTTEQLPLEPDDSRPTDEVLDPDDTVDEPFDGDEDVEPDDPSLELDGRIEDAAPADDAR